MNKNFGTVGRVTHTHTHTQGNLNNKPENKTKIYTKNNVKRCRGRRPRRPANETRT